MLSIVWLLRKIMISQNVMNGYLELMVTSSLDENSPTQAIQTLEANFETYHQTVL